MNNASYDEIKKLLDRICEERDILEKKIEENNVSIREADFHAESIMVKEDEDFKVFSPRTKDGLNREKLEQLEKQKEEYYRQNNLLFHDRNRLNSMIDILRKIIREEKSFDNNLAVMKILAEERQRIARDLHDTSLQNLTHLMHKIEISMLFIDQDPVRAKLELAVVNKNLKEVINDIRNTVFNLRPMVLDDLGVKAAFERLLAQFNMDRRYELELDIENVSCENELVLLTLYRVVQESLNNIRKHSDADRICFSCRKKNDCCVIIVEDNGKGFTQEDVERKENKHFGISLMRERVELVDGRFEIISEINVGTKVKIEIPLV